MLIIINIAMISLQTILRNSIETPTAETNCKPNENELQIALLMQHGQGLGTVCHRHWHFGRSAGRKTPLFGASSPQYKQVSGLKFTRSTAE